MRKLMFAVLSFISLSPAMAELNGIAPALATGVQAAQDEAKIIEGLRTTCEAWRRLKDLDRSSAVSSSGGSSLSTSIPTSTGHSY